MTTAATQQLNNLLTKMRKATTPPPAPERTRTSKYYGSPEYDGAMSTEERQVAEACARLSNLESRLWNIRSKLKENTSIEDVRNELSAISGLLGGSTAAAVDEQTGAEANDDEGEDVEARAPDLLSQVTLKNVAMTPEQFTAHVIGEVVGITKALKAGKLAVAEAHYVVLAKAIAVAKRSFENEEAPASVPTIDQETNSEFTASQDYSGEQENGTPWNGYRDRETSQLEENREAVTSTRTPSPGPVEGAVPPGRDRDANMLEQNREAVQGESGPKPSELTDGDPLYFLGSPVAKRIAQLEKRLAGTPAAPRQQTQKSAPPAADPVGDDSWPDDLGSSEFLSGKEQQQKVWGKDNEPFPDVVD